MENTMDVVEVSELTNKFLTENLKDIDIGFVPKPVNPGDDITSFVTQISKAIHLGPGLVRNGARILCEISGILQYRSPSTYWIEENNRKRYWPNMGDQVVGLIEDKGSEFYKVNIFGGPISLLNRLAFEGATKRNKPELKKGDVVYARVCLADKDLDTEVTCITSSSSSSKKEWSSGETVYGLLTGGITVRVSTSCAREMLKNDSVLLNCLGRHFPFEVCVGMNGVVWLKAANALDSIIVRNAIINAEGMNSVQIEAMVDELAARAHRAI